MTNPACELTVCCQATALRARTGGQSGTGTVFSLVSVFLPLLHTDLGLTLHLSEGPAGEGGNPQAK